MAKIYMMMAEIYSIDKGVCKYSLSEGEHVLLWRKMMTIFKRQMTDPKHFV